MTQVQHNPGGGIGPAGEGAVHLLLVEGEVSLIAADPASVMEEIEARATQVSSTLQKILTEPHGHSDWGINE
jgi:hypothetical protein